MPGSLLLSNIKSLYQVRENVHDPLRGQDMAVLPYLNDAFVLIENGRIRDFGTMAEAPSRADQVIDCDDRFVLPCWCDSHTHLVFAASREGEFIDRIHGLSYEEIAERGGGILNSAARLQETPEDVLFEQSLARLEEVIQYGTGAIEIKSGYGLTPDSELKMLRVIRRLKEVAPIPVKATFLGAHALPLAFRDDRAGYIRQIIKDMLPVISDEGLADYIDAFCEKGFFTLSETEQIIEAGVKYGLRPKLHVNQLTNSGGVQLAVRHDAVSADHLEQTGKDETLALKESSTIATVLPSCSFFLNIPYAPARELIDGGAALALATDYNPGSTPSGKMPFVISLACIQMKLTPEEAINAATINGSFAMGLQGECGTVTKGKRANLIITKKIPSIAYIPYAFGSDHIEKVVLSNKVCHI